MPKLRSYMTGFALSIVLTLAAFFIVIRPGFFGLGTNATIGVILALAVAQLLVQVFFFLHLGSETGTRWKLWAFISTIGVVLIVIVGALWIMDHLNYNMMASPDLMQHYIQSQDSM